MTRTKRKEKTAALKHQPPSRHAARVKRQAMKPTRPKTDKQFTLHLPNKPGQMAKLGRALKKGGVNLMGMCATEQTDVSTVRLVVDNKSAARAAFRTAGLPFSERDVLLVPAENHPGALGEIGARLAKEKINVEYAYASTAPDNMQAMIILAVDHTRKAVRVLS